MLYFHSWRYFFPLMFLDINVYRAVIGLFHSSRCKVLKTRFKYFDFSFRELKFLMSCITALFMNVLIFHLIFLYWYVSFQSSNSNNFFLDDSIFLLLIHIHFMKLQLLMCGDVHKNPGPHDEKNKLSILHWT